MELQNGIIIGLIGTIGGLLSGLLGLGGAIVIIPALVFALGFSQQMAQGTTLLMMVLPVSALAAWQYYKAGNVDVKTAIVLGITFFISSYFGAKLAIQIPQEILKKGFAIILILIALKILLFDKS
jgi:uncharacterized membrane protein YfcA